MSSPRTRSAARLAGASVALVLAGVSAAGAARPGATLREQAHSLGARAHLALLDLYALDSQLHAAQARLATLQAQAAELRKEQAQLAQQLSAARRTLAVSRHELGDNLSLLYKQDDVSALAVVLGSQSLDEAVTRLDDLTRVADQSRQVVQITADAQTKLNDLRTTLGARQAALDAAVADAGRTAAALDSARTARISFIAGLRRQQQLKTAQIHSLEARAMRVEHKSNALQAAAVAGDSAGVAVTPSETPPTITPTASVTQPVGARTITVTTTGYSLPGHTATGMPVGWGVVAVDPAVIPLGTRLTIPGYGEAVAADTGGAVRGNTLDLWFPTLAQAQAWGRRTLTITLH